MSNKYRPDLPTLAERSGVTPPPTPVPGPGPDTQQQPTEHPATTAPPTTPVGPPGPVRPVWVLDSDGWIPGLLRGWERQDDGIWLGDVVLASHGRVGEYLVYAQQLRPAATEPPPRPPLHPAPDIATP